MAVPVSQAWTVATYVLKQKMKGRKRFPLVTMLEPLFRCNLACAGCGKIQYPPHILKQELTPEECFRAVEESGTPMVSIPGGEPLLHPQIDKIVAGLVERKKYVYLCTNALLLKEKLHLFKPEQVSVVFRSPRRPARAPRLLRLPRGRLRHRDGRDQGRGRCGLPRDDEHDAVRRSRSQLGARALRRSDGQSASRP